MNYYNSRPLTLLSRLAAVSYRLGSLAAKLWLDKKVGDGSGWDKNMESRATEFVEFVQGAGPAFIKIGQGVSIRPDILPEPYLKELVKLQDRVSVPLSFRCLFGSSAFIGLTGLIEASCPLRPFALCECGRFVRLLSFTFDSDGPEFTHPFFLACRSLFFHGGWLRTCLFISGEAVRLWRRPENPGAAAGQASRRDFPRCRHGLRGPRRGGISWAGEMDVILCVVEVCLVWGEKLRKTRGARTRRTRRCVYREQPPPTSDDEVSGATYITSGRQTTSYTNA